MIIVSAHEDFLNNVAEIVVDVIEKLVDPLDAVNVRVFLPNNRSCRILKDILVKRNGINILPRFVVPIDEKSAAGGIAGIYDVFQCLDVKCTNIAKFELAASIFNEVQNVIYEKISIDEATNKIANSNMVELFLKSFNAAAHHVKIAQISCCTDYVKYSNVPFICAGFSYSHAYVLDFLKAANENKCGILVFQQQIDHNHLFSKLMSYIGENKCFQNNDVKCDPSNVATICANTLLDEANTIATIIRSHIGKSITVVYTDKQLMHTVKAYAKKWNINIDDSVGIPFKETRECVLFLLILQALKSNFKTNETLEILEYINIFDCDKIKKYALQNWKIRFIDIDEFYEYTQHPAIIYLRSIANKFSRNDVSFNEYIVFFEECFYFFAEYITIRNKDILRTIFEYLYLFGKHINSIDDYYHIAIKIIDKFSIRKPVGYTQNVIAIGPLEAQLITSDIVIVCGFSDQNWITSSNSYLFYNVNDLRLDIETRRNHDITNTLHHIIQSSERTFITYSSSTSDGISRLINEFFCDEQIDILKLNGASWTFSDSAEKTPLTIPPSPCPAIQYRPLCYSASDIELLHLNPYAIYCKKILKLEDLNDVTSESYKSRLKGTIFHNAMSIAKTQRSISNSNSLIKNVENIMSNLQIDQHHFLDWLLKLELAANFVAEYVSDDELSEITGCTTLTISGYCVTLKCIADSIVISNAGIVIVDYKTGSLPSYKEILSLKKPQLLVEGIIAYRNGFFGIHNKKILDLVLMRVGSSKKSQNFLKLSECRDVQSIEHTIEVAEKDIIKLLDKFLSGLSSYTAISGGYYDSYAHLARGAEWGTYI